jgi:hypothetical protein
VLARMLIRGEETRALATNVYYATSLDGRAALGPGRRRRGSVAKAP